MTSLKRALSEQSMRRGTAKREVRRVGAGVRPAAPASEDSVALSRPAAPGSGGLGGLELCLQARDQRLEPQLESGVRRGPGGTGILNRTAEVKCGVAAAMLPESKMSAGAVTS